MALITFKTFDNAIDAHILRLKLESEGISCFIFDEHVVSVNPLYSNLVGGVKIKINEEDLIHAKNVVYEIEHTPLTTENGAEIKCPKCNSIKVESGYYSMNSAGAILSAIISFLLFVFPIYRKRVYRCIDCDFEFNLQEQKKD